MTDERTTTIEAELAARRAEAEEDLRRLQQPARDYLLGHRILEHLAFREGESAMLIAATVRRREEAIEGWLEVHRRLGLARRSLAGGLEGWYITPAGELALEHLGDGDAPPTREVFAGAVRWARDRLASRRARSRPGRRP